MHELTIADEIPYGSVVGVAKQRTNFGHLTIMELGGAALLGFRCPTGAVHDIRPAVRLARFVAQRGRMLQPAAPGNGMDELGVSDRSFFPDATDPMKFSRAEQTPNLR